MSNDARNKTAFKFVRSLPDAVFDEEGCVFEGVFQLPDDGTPDAEQFLKVTVQTYDAGNTPANVELAVLTSIGGKRKLWPIGGFETNAFEALTRLLYGAAKAVVVRKFTPIPQ